MNIFHFIFHLKRNEFEITELGNFHGKINNANSIVSKCFVTIELQRKNLFYTISELNFLNHSFRHLSSLSNVCSSIIKFRNFTFCLILKFAYGFIHFFVSKNTEQIKKL